MYTDRNFKKKADLKRAVANGDRVTIYQPGPFGGPAPKEGTFAVEGPHYPQPHRWYASVTVENYVITKVR